MMTVDHYPYSEDVFETLGRVSDAYQLARRKSCQGVDELASLQDIGHGSLTHIGASDTKPLARPRITSFDSIFDYYLYYQRCDEDDSSDTHDGRSDSPIEKPAENLDETHRLSGMILSESPLDTLMRLTLMELAPSLSHDDIEQQKKMRRNCVVQRPLRASQAGFRCGAVSDLDICFKYPTCEKRKCRRFSLAKDFVQKLLLSGNGTQSPRPPPPVRLGFSPPFCSPRISNSLLSS